MGMSHNFNQVSHDSVLSPRFNSRRLVITALATLSFIILLSLYAADAASTSKLHAAIQASANTQALKLNTAQSSSPSLPSLEQITTPNTEGEATQSPTSNLEVTVNGQPVTIPGSGSTQQQVTSPGGQSSNVTVTQDQSGSGNATNTSSSTTNLSITGGSSSTARSNTNISVHTSSP
jgi:hypothetical protein